MDSTLALVLLLVVVACVFLWVVLRAGARGTAPKSGKPSVPTSVSEEQPRRTAALEDGYSSRHEHWRMPRTLDDERRSQDEQSWDDLHYDEDGTPYGAMDAQMDDWV